MADRVTISLFFRQPFYSLNLVSILIGLEWVSHDTVSISTSAGWVGLIKTGAVQESFMTKKTLSQKLTIRNSFTNGGL